MIRRNFIRLSMALGLFTLFKHTQGREENDHQNVVRFTIAGVRFNTDAPIQPVGSRLAVHREIWNGEPALALLDMDGSKIGFVPRKLVPLLDGHIHRVQLVRSNPHALPWKRYMVEAEYS